MQFLRNRGEPDQVVHDNVHRAANTVGRDVRKIECLGKNTLSGECAIAMDQQWQKLLASAFACPVLLCASAAHGDWINRLKMARVRNQMDMYLRAAAGFGPAGARRPRYLAARRSAAVRRLLDYRFPALTLGSIVFAGTARS